MTIQCTHVIFDVDGLLLDTERLYSESTQKVCDEFGKTYTWDLKSAVMGKGEKNVSKIITEVLGLPMTPEEYIRRTREIQKTLFPTAKLLPGAEKLVRHLHEHKIPIAVASGSDNWCFELKTTNHQEFFKLFHHTVLCSDDPEVEHSKPAPDGFIVAAKRFGDAPDPAKILVFEDAPNGVIAANAAGMHCIWVPAPEVTQADDVKSKAILILDSLELFKPEDFGLPSYSQ
ncbi:hypothetical protein ScPMuIL_017485 [Solemya velum]